MEAVINTNCHKCGKKLNEENREEGYDSIVKCPDCRELTQVMYHG